MNLANQDITYCTNSECNENCWRYKNNWHFESDKNYWFMECCEDKIKRNDNK